MAIEKGLIIKSLLGVSAVGGGVTVVAVGHKEGWLSTLGTTTTSDSEQEVNGSSGAVNENSLGNANAGTGQSGISSAGGSQSEQATRTSTTTQTADNVSQKKKFEELKIPDNCEILETDTTTTFKDCDVSKEDLVKIAFKDKEEDQDLTVDATENDFTGMKLEVKKLGEEEKKHYGSSPEFIFTFKDFDKTVTLNKNDTEVVKLVKGTNPVFKKTNDNKLERIFADEASICELIGLTCGTDSVTLKDGKTLGQKESDSFKEYTITDTGNLKDKIEVSKGEQDYNQGFKFEIKQQINLQEKTNEGNSGSVSTKTLNNGNYQVLLMDGDNGGWYLEKKEEPAA